jgi:hypothetical protein
MTATELPGQCPLCGEGLEEPSVDGLERHLPACTATEKRRPEPDPPVGGATRLEKSKWLRKGRKP